MSKKFEALEKYFIHNSNTPRLYSQMVKNHVLFGNDSLGRNVTLFGTVYDVILPIDHISLTLDGVTSFLNVINVRNISKLLCYSQTSGRISSVQWRKVVLESK